MLCVFMLCAAWLHHLGIMYRKTPLMMAVKRTKYQYSLRLDRPPNTAYFFNASMYQLTLYLPPISDEVQELSHPVCSSRIR